MKQITSIEISTGTLLRFFLIIIGIYFIYLIRTIVMMILVSIVIASTIEPLIRWLVRYKLPRVVAAILVYFVGFMSFFVVLYVLIPPLLQDFRVFFGELPALFLNALESLQNVAAFLPIEEFQPALDNFVANADLYVGQIMGRIASTSSLIVASLFKFAFVIVISFYLAVQEDGIGSVLRFVIPQQYENYIVGLWKRSEHKIGRWLQGQLLLGLIVGSLVFITLTILRVKFAFTLAFLAFIFEMIPYVGPIMAAIPGVVIATIQNPALGLVVLLIYFIIQQIENHLIYPVVVRKTIGVHPLLAIIALLIGGALGGIMGFIVSIPAAVVLMEFLDDRAALKNSHA